MNGNNIGVFWIFEKQLFVELQLLDDIQSINGFKDSDLSHYHVWKKVKKLHSKFYILEYEDVPRGRIVFDISNNQFIVYCNKDILLEEISKKLILNKFELSKQNTLFKVDEHYEISK